MMPEFDGFKSKGRIVRIGISIFVVLAAATIANAQAGTSQTGRALDSNYQVGSSGVNYAVTTYAPPASQLYVSGQVRGLGGFHGNTGYYAPDQLNLRLPGGTISNFTRQSVGVSDAVRGMTYLPAAYYDPAQTVGSAADYSTGRVRPGHTAPTPGISGVGLAQRLYVDAKQDYTDVMVSPSSGLGLIDKRIMGGIKTSSTVFGTSPQAARMDLSAPFDIGSSADRFEIAREFYRQGDKMGDANRRVDAAIDVFINSQKDMRTDKKLDDDSRNTEGGELEKYVEMTGHRPTPGASPDKLGKNQQLLDNAPKGDDVFFDLLVNIQKKKSGESAEKPAAKKTDFQGEEEQPVVEHGIEMKDGLIVMHGLSGKKRDLYNAYLAKAEKLSLSGRFYSAVRELENADMLDPANPLARVGMSVAYLGAGEPLTAANYLYDAVAIFPPLMEVRIDLDTMIEKSVQEERIAELDKIIAEKGQKIEPAILMLATFVNFGAGHDDRAKTLAQAMDKHPGSLPLMKAYAAYIITGKSRANTTTGPAAPASQSSQPVNP